MLLPTPMLLENSVLRVALLFGLPAKSKFSNEHSK